MELNTFKVVNFLGLNKNVELKFQDNKLIMVGENGSGKSQLMRIFTLFFNDLEELANRNFEKIIANINDKEIVVIKDKLKKDYSNFDEEYLTMEISESPVSEWSKEDEYSNWFASFDNIEEEDNDDGFEVIESSEVNGGQTAGGDDDDD